MSKRKRGERIWEGSERQFGLHIDVPEEPKSPRRSAFHIEELSTTPPSYLVYDKTGNVWHIVVAVDGALEVAERSSDAYHNMESRVLRAVHNKINKP